MQEQSLEQVIRQYVYLPPTPNSKGWFPVVHKGCDHGGKGPRAAFNFSDGAVAFHCFNCGVSTVFDPNTHNTMPKKMATVLSDFGIHEEEWQPIIFELFGKHKSGKQSRQRKQQTDIEPTELHVPQPFYLLSQADHNDKWAQIATDYLINERDLDPNSYPFMLCGKHSDHKQWDKWRRRLIIPIYKQDKLVFYQGRALTNNVQPKYLSPPVPKERVLYGYERIFEKSDNPIYVVEGWFDAFKLGGYGVALLGNEITDQQIRWLNRTPRTKVYIPDRFGNGRQTAERALVIGWSISTPPIGSCKDIADAVNRYGLLYVLKSITDNTTNDMFEAHTQLGFFCNK